MEIRRATAEDRPSIDSFLKEIERQKPVLARFFRRLFEDGFLGDIFIAEEERVVGLMTRRVTRFAFNGVNYSFSSIHLPIVLEEYEKSDILLELEAEVKKIDKEENVTFSTLIARRKAANLFGYEKGPYSHIYLLDDYLLADLEEDESLMVEKMKQDDIKSCFSLYKEKASLILREEDDFFFTLKRQGFEPYVVKREEKIIGYLNVSKRGVIDELMIEPQLIYPIAKRLLKLLSLPSLKILLSPLESEKNKYLAKTCDSIHIFQSTNLKVYDWMKFLRLIFSLNIQEFDEDTSLTFAIDGRKYTVNVQTPKVSIKEDERKKADVIISSMNLIQLLFSPLSHKSSAFLPLYFTLPLPDLF